MLLCYFGLYPLLHLMVIYVMMILLYFLSCMLCESQFIISYSYSLSKVFYCSIINTTRKIEIFESCPVRDRAGRRAMGSITS
jgi:hypothetical protein